MAWQTPPGPPTTRQKIDEIRSHTSILRLKRTKKSELRHYAAEALHLADKLEKEVAAFKHFRDFLLRYPYHFGLQQMPRREDMQASVWRASGVRTLSGTIENLEPGFANEIMISDHIRDMTRDHEKLIKLEAVHRTVEALLTK